MPQLITDLGAPSAPYTYFGYHSLHSGSSLSCYGWTAVPWPRSGWLVETTHKGRQKMQDMSSQEKATHLLMMSDKNQTDYAQVQRCAISKQFFLFWCLRKFGRESDRSYVRIIGWDGQSPKWAKWSDRHNLWMNQRLLHGKCHWLIYLHAYIYLVRRLKSEEKNNLRYQPRVRPKSACTELSSESSSENPRPHHTS